jgi:tryptophanyl-tRNA synthetase
VEVKRRLTRAINDFLSPLREVRARFERAGVVDDVLIAGTRRARGIAQMTMDRVYDALGLYGPRLLPELRQIPTVLAR